MASSRNNSTIQWSASGSTTVSSATAVTSDAFTYNIEDWEADLAVKADNQGAAASGDVCDVYVAYSYDGTNFDTTEHAQYVGRIDTVAANTPGEDPGQLSVPLRTAAKAFKVIVSCPQAASRNILVTANVVTHRPQ